MNGPYSVAAQDYFNEGWSPIPFPFKTKWPPADGFTGAQGKYLDEKQLRRWLGPKGRATAGNMTWSSAQGNIGLRLHPNFLGIDVDMYGSKTGRKTFEAAIAAWGELPPTWYATSREDGSGIRLFRIPEGLAWPGKLPQGGGVELIRWDHRYVICAPSIHPDTGEEYKWYHDERGQVEFEIPGWDQIPFLPEAWVTGLTSGKKWESRASADMDAEDVRAWLSDRNGGKACATMRRTLTQALRHVRTAGDDGGAHDAARDGAWGLIGDAQAGHAGIEPALIKLQKAFTLAVAPRRGQDGERLAKEEWARIVIRGVQKVAAEGEAERDDLCALLAGGAASSGSGGGTDGDSGDHQGHSRDSGDGNGRAKLWDFRRDDGGNAQRLVYAYRYDMRVCEAIAGKQRWLVWDGHVWAVNKHEVVRRAQEVVQDMESEAQEIEDPKERKAFMSFIRSSSMAPKIRAMIDLAESARGIAVPASEFDANPNYLGCRNGLVRLGSDGVVERVPAQPEHRLTLSTGTDFDPDARSELWDRFIVRCQPDEDVRAWLQKLVGYTLYGSNDERLFIVAYGPTTTGKTTFAEALNAALGDYAGVTNMTVFRDNQDEKPRMDLAKVMSKRFVYAEEASQEWHLHPDQIKRVTGGAGLPVRRLYADYEERKPAFTPWLLTNAPPRIENADAAFMKRLIVVPFDQQIPKDQEVAGYRTRLMSEARAAVLAWAVRGWQMYCADPNLATPLNAEFARQEFVGGLSPFDVMLGEAFELDPTYREKPIALWQAYQRWCSDSGIKERDKLDRNKFWAALDMRGYSKTSTRVDGKPIPCRRGIRVSAEYARIVPEAFPRG